jgi:hypothetical protein
MVKQQYYLTIILSESFFSNESNLKLEVGLKMIFDKHFLNLAKKKFKFTHLENGLDQLLLFFIKEKIINFIKSFNY